jgi:hypothetical protein
MKITAIISAFVALLIFASAPLRAADAPADSSAESSKHMHYHGTVMAIDMSANTVTLQTDHGTMTMTIDADTKFRGGSKSLGDFKVGDTISGSYMMDDSGKMMAVSMKAYRSKE